MSYVFAIAGDARSDLLTMDAWVQEEVLDELERIAADPTLLPAAGPDNEIVYSFNRSVRGIRHYFAAVLVHNPDSEIVTLLGISDHSPAP